MAPIVEAHQLTRGYAMGGTRPCMVVRDVSLEVHPGEMVTILGRPGSGKSTLLHMLGCLLRPSSGLVRIEGQDMTRLDNERRVQIRSEKIGFVFQAFKLLPGETALTNVELPLKHRGVNSWDRREKAEAVLRVVGLGNRLDYTLGRLSERQRQCVAIAGAIVHEPAVLFVDEPTRALDGTSQEELMGLLQHLNDQGHTIVMTTSDSGVARFCPRVFRIADGTVTEEESAPGRVPRRATRVIPASARPEGDREVVVCSRCNYGNFKGEAACSRCDFPLELSEVDQQSIEGRIGGANSPEQGVESDSDEAEETDEQTDQELISELKALPLFSGLGSKNLAKVVAALAPQSYKKGTPILSQGEEGDAFYIIRSGRARVLLERGGEKLTIAELSPGEGFGEMALLTGQPRSATIVARSDTEVWRLPKTDFDQLLAENISLAVYFNRTLSARLLALQEKIIP